MKYCEYCGKELLSEKRKNKYCDIHCQLNAQQDAFISKWKSYEETGNRANGQLSNYVRNYMLERAHNKCELCGWSAINPTTGLVPLEIHHIDGNATNSYEDNLQVLCPNCHSLTPNFKALNRDSSRERTQTRKTYCIDCGIEISDGALRCRPCNDKYKTTEKPISRDELKHLIRTLPFTEIGKQFNITDNAIRKWCIYYELPSKKKDIKNYTDEEWASV